MTYSNLVLTVSRHLNGSVSKTCDFADESWNYLLHDTRTLVFSCYGSPYGRYVTMNLEMYDSTNFDLCEIRTFGRRQHDKRKNTRLVWNFCSCCCCSCFFCLSLIMSAIVLCFVRLLLLSLFYSFHEFNQNRDFQFTLPKIFFPVYRPLNQINKIQYIYIYIISKGQKTLYYFKIATK